MTTFSANIARFFRWATDITATQEKNPVRLEPSEGQEENREERVRRNSEVFLRRHADAWKELSKR